MEHSINVGPLEYLWPRAIVLVTTVDENGKPNIVPVTFHTPVSHKPPLVAIALDRASYSLKSIKKTKEFVINIPPRKLRRHAMYCGYSSGRNVDKFERTKLTPEPAKKAKPPVIGECIAHLECKLVDQLETGDKTLLLGEIIASYADRDIIGKFSTEYALFSEKYHKCY